MQPDKKRAQMKELDGDDDRGVDRASHNQILGEGKTSEPIAHRSIHDEHFDPADRDSDQESVYDTRRHIGSRGVTQHYGKYDSPDDTAGDNACKQSQLSFKPCVHAAHPRLGADYTRTPICFVGQVRDSTGRNDVGFSPA